MIDLATGTYFSLQGGAADVWTLISAGHSSDAMTNSLAAAYGESEDSIRPTLERFVKELESEALIVETADSGSAVDSQAAPEISPNGASFLPSLEKHTDMAELILLDPVHEVDSMGWPHRPEDA